MTPDLTADQLNAQYNNRALVPDFQQYFDAWALRSVQARQQPCVLDVAYGDDPGEKLDIFPAPSGTVQAPVMVFIHGGYWRSLDKSDHSFIAPPFTAHGVCVVVVNYALCPQVTVPDITLQMVRALTWVHDHIAGYGGDASNITVVGHSAGGHLAAMLLCCEWSRFRVDLPESLVRQAMALSGLFDLEPIRRTPFLQASLHLTPDHVRRASPAYFKAPRGKTLVAVVGGSESPEFIRQNQLIAKKWGAKVVPVCETCPGLHHFSILDALAEPKSRVMSLCTKLVSTDGR